MPQVDISPNIAKGGYDLAVDNTIWLEKLSLPEALLVKDEIVKPDFHMRFRWASLGLGDHIVMSAAVVLLAKRLGKPLFIPVRDGLYRESLDPMSMLKPVDKRSRTSIESIYVNHPEIRFEDPGILVERDKIEREQGLRLFVGEEMVAINDFSTDIFQRMYRMAGIPYYERWRSSPIPEAAKLVTQLPFPFGPYVFVHDDTSRGHAIEKHRLPSNIPIYRPESIDGSILRYCDILENATEVHVIDSSFFNLVEQLEPKGKLVLHRYAREYKIYQKAYQKLKYNWQILA